MREIPYSDYENMFSKWLARLNESRAWRRPVSFQGMRFVPPTLDRWAALQAHRFGLMGTAELRFFQRTIRRNWHIADVGANQGLYTLYFSRHAVEGRVYAFEPDPRLFAALKENIQRNRVENVTLFNAAVSSQNAKLLLQPGRLNRGDNRIVQDAVGPGTIAVDAVMLDQAITELGLDLLKVDVQGFEMEVLRGAERLMRANPELVICLEFWPHGLRIAGSSPEELLDLLHGKGFSLFRLCNGVRCEPFTYRPMDWDRHTQFCNLVATRSAIPRQSLQP